MYKTSCMTLQGIVLNEKKLTTPRDFTLYDCTHITLLKRQHIRYEGQGGGGQRVEAEEPGEVCGYARATWEALVGLALLCVLPLVVDTWIYTGEKIVQSLNRSVDK